MAHGSVGACGRLRRRRARHPHQASDGWYELLPHAPALVFQAAPTHLLALRGQGREILEVFGGEAKQTSGAAVTEFHATRAVLLLAEGEIERAQEEIHEWDEAADLIETWKVQAREGRFFYLLGDALARLGSEMVRRRRLAQMEELYHPGRGFLGWGMDYIKGTLALWFR